MIGWYVEQEYARLPLLAKHALLAPEAAAPLDLLQDFTGPLAPGDKLDVYPQAGSQQSQVVVVVPAVAARAEVAKDKTEKSTIRMDTIASVVDASNDCDVPLFC